jgi:hypothetical protein
MKKTAPRDGYALALVLVFMVLLLSLSSLAYRQVAVALRVESVRSVQVVRDEGSLHALARALALLQTGLPPSNPYVCGVTIDTSSGPRAFTITMSSEDDTNWSINSTPTQDNENPDPMPATFQAP